jgi:hypothetical protein
MLQSWDQDIDVLLLLKRAKPAVCGPLCLARQLSAAKSPVRSSDLPIGSRLTGWDRAPIRCELQQEMTMFTKSMIALGAAVVMTATLGSTAIAQTSSREWWRAYQPNAETGYGRVAPKQCIRGEESAASSYPSWMHC